MTSPLTNLHSFTSLPSSVSAIIFGDYMVDTLTVDMPDDLLSKFIKITDRFGLKRDDVVNKLIGEWVDARAIALERKQSLITEFCPKK